MAQGIWIHTDKQRTIDGHLGERRERALRWARGRCQAANVYIGHKDWAVGQVDTRCRRCGVRVRFNLKRRKDSRGSPSQAIWIPRPKDTRSELEAKVSALNKISSGKQGGGDEGFVTALELMKQKRPRTMGGESDE